MVDISFITRLCIIYVSSIGIGKKPSGRKSSINSDNVNWILNYYMALLPQNRNSSPNVSSIEFETELWGDKIAIKKQQ